MNEDGDDGVPAVLIGTHAAVLVVDASRGTVREAAGLNGRRPSALAWDPFVPGRAWCGTTKDGVFRSDDWGESWESSGLAGVSVTALSPSPAREGLIWAGTEPSSIRRSDDHGESWTEAGDLETLPSSSEWSFPPRPDTHHVRWIACHPHRDARLWAAVEAGALIRTRRGGEEWEDRVPDGPRDTHELAIHPGSPDVLRVSAGDGYFESRDGGSSWITPREGLEVNYMRSVAIDPGDQEVVLASGAEGPRSAYVGGRSDGRVYRRVGDGPWNRILDGWPEPPDVIAPLLRAGTRPGELWAADERGIHLSRDGGISWNRVASFSRTPEHLRGFAVRRRS